MRWHGGEKPPAGGAGRGRGTLFVVLDSPAAGRAGRGGRAGNRSVAATIFLPPKASACILRCQDAGGDAWGGRGCTARCGWWCWWQQVGLRCAWIKPGFERCDCSAGASGPVRWQTGRSFAGTTPPYYRLSPPAACFAVRPVRLPLTPDDLQDECSPRGAEGGRRGKGEERACSQVRTVPAVAAAPLVEVPVRGAAVHNAGGDRLKANDR